MSRYCRVVDVTASGSLLCITSAIAFGLMAAFGKLAFDQGVTPGTLLVVRFALAAALLWSALILRGRTAEVRRIPRRDLAMALALGSFGYALQAGCYFLALRRIDASLLALLLYTFPAIVMCAAVAVGRERFDLAKAGALGLVSIGLVLVLAGAGTGKLQSTGVELGLGAAFTYSAYILLSHGVAVRIPALVFATLVCTGAAISLSLVTAVSGQLHLGSVSAAGWGWLGCIAAVSTVAAIALFFAGLSRVGPSVASILSTVEPVVTVAVAGALFAETMSAVQLLGAALVLSAVVAIQTRAVAV
jgi:drug/metabolite transporter (DMT)-like permease